MAGINVVVISGNITRDPDLKATTDGTGVLSFGLAVPERRRDSQTGEWTERPNYVDCVVFGKRATALSRYLRRGTRTTVKGRLHQSSWEKDGAKRSKIEIFVDDLDFSNGAEGPSSDETEAEEAPAAYAQ